MPNFEYRCHNCGETKEVQRLIAERHNAICCDNCETLMEMVPAAPGFKVVGGTPKGRGRQK